MGFLHFANARAPSIGKTNQNLSPLEWLAVRKTPSHGQCEKCTGGERDATRWVHCCLMNAPVSSCSRMLHSRCVMRAAIPNVGS